MFTNDVDSSGNEVGVACEFVRGGLCKTHKVIGKKIVVSAMKWRKYKSGIFRNMRTQQTMYICKVKSSGHIVSDIATSARSQRLGENTLDGACKGLERERDCVDILKEKVS